MDNHMEINVGVMVVREQILGKFVQRVLEGWVMSRLKK